MKKLYLLRHAQSGHPPKVDDRDRPLNIRGIQECTAMHAYLSEHGIMPEMVICSDAIRTETTAREVFKGIDANIIPVGKLYLATAGEIIKEINKIGDDVNLLMVVGHNPGIQQFAAVLAENNSKAIFAGSREYRTCALAEFSVNISKWQDIEPGSGKLERFTGH